MSQDWTLRDALVEDEACIVSTWLKGYARADEVREKFPLASQDGHADQIRFWRVYQPIVESLVRGGHVRVICDPERASYEPGEPAVIWAWACCTGDVVHWVCIKRSAARAGIGEDLARELLGDRLEREQTTTFELTDLPKAIRIPRIWKRDRQWLAAMRTLSTRMLAGDATTARVGAHVLDTQRETWRASTERAA